MKLNARKKQKGILIEAIWLLRSSSMTTLRLITIRMQTTLIDMMITFIRVCNRIPWPTIKKLELESIAPIRTPNHTRLGATSIEKIQKISASGRNFLDPLPTLFEKGPYRRKRRYFVPNSNYKVRFFWTFNPALFHQNAEPHRFLQLRWPLTD